LNAAALSEGDGEESIRRWQAKVTTGEVEAKVLGHVGRGIQAHVLP
jgi:hypothetical protein